MIWDTCFKQKLSHRTWFRRKPETQINHYTSSKNLHQQLKKQKPITLCVYYNSLIPNLEYE